MRRRTKKTKRQSKTKQKKLPDWTEPIACELLSRSQFADHIPEYEPNSLRRGTYHGSWFREVGPKRWVVGTYLDVDYKTFLKKGLSIEDVLAGCFIYLNQPPDRKKYQRRIKNPIYGNLEPMPIQHGFKVIDEKEYIWVLLVTDKRKCKHFWGEGMKQ